jgi:hypothetical protein
MIALLVILAATPQDLTVEQTIEQTKKNIKVLQGLPSSQLIPVMAFMANSLGVTCAHCHGKEYDSDEKPAKDAARKMIALQRAINQQHYGGKLTVTCNTCHQGRVLPPATPDVADAGWNARPAGGEDAAGPAAETAALRNAGVPPAGRAASSPPFPVKPDDAISGEEAIVRLFEATSEIKHRVVRGTVERYNGRDEPKSAPFTLTLGDTIEYHTELSHPSEATRALALFLPARPKPEQVKGERWIIAADRVRRLREIPTPLGNLPEEVTFEDFRQTDGGKLPFRTQWSRADYRVTFTVESIE